MNATLRNRVIAGCLALLAAPLFAQTAEQTTNEQILKELQAMRDIQQQTLDRLTLIGAILGAPDKAEHPAPGGWARQGPDTVKLAKIILPENPTEQQVRDYVNAIIEATEGQNTFGPNDPQMRKFMAVGPANMKALIQPLRDETAGQAQHYIISAIERLAEDEHKDLIVGALPFAHDLAQIVVKKRWQNDARPALLEVMKEQPDYLPTEWINAVASFKDPATYDGLMWYLVNGANGSWTYKAVSGLPGFDAEKGVKERWQRVKDEGHPWEEREAAALAVAVGDLDALRAEFDFLDDEEQDNFGPAENSPARIIRRYTDARGKREEMQKWYKENKAFLVFDKEAKKFKVVPPAVLPGGQAPAAPNAE